MTFKNISGNNLVNWIIISIIFNNFHLFRFLLLVLGMTALANMPNMMSEVLETGCDVNSDKACVSYDFSSSFFDYNSTYDFYGDNSTYYDFYGENSTYYDFYEDNSTDYDYYYNSDYCEMKPLLHIAVAMNSTDFLEALKKVDII